MQAGILLLATCFLLSGFGSLALEVVWTRQLRLVFGSTTLAASTILVAYMLGLGLGGLAGGRVADRLRDGVRAYGWIEIAIGLYALLVPTLIGWFPVLNRTVLQDLSFWPAALGRFVLALGLFLIPTVLMGATLPILVAALVRHDPRIARGSGLLYGINTLGAVAGVFVATFVLFPAVGVWRTNLIGALVDIAVGVLAVALLPLLIRGAPATVDAAAARARDAGHDVQPDVRPTATPTRLAPQVDAHVAPAAVLTAYAGVGLVALVCEVGWMRGLAIVLGSSIYGFAAMLGAFLSGIALGSLIFRRWAERTRRPVLLLGVGLAALGVLALATTAALPELPSVFLRLITRSPEADRSLVFLQVVFCMATLLPPTLILGGLFPLLARIVAASTRDAGVAIGWVYFANTIGAAAGAFVAGFVLLPTIGLERMLALASALALALASLFLIRAARGTTTRVAAAAPLAAAIALLSTSLPFDRAKLTRGVFHSPDAHMTFAIEMVPFAGEARPSLLYYRDGINATISVHRLAGMTAMKVNGKVDASDGEDMPNQVLPAHVALLFGPPARDVLVIGWASGVTVGSVAQHDGVERIDAVEIEPAVIEASHFFDDVNGRPLDDPRVRVILDDGRTFLENAQDAYDVIISQPSNPWMTGVANLFTHEFFKAASRALRPDGRLLQWMQLYGMEPESLAAVLAAMRAEFPYVYGFADRGMGANVLLLAMRRPLTRDDLPRWEDLDDGVREDLRRVRNFSTEDLWSLLRVLPPDVDRLARRASVRNSDGNLFIELRAPLVANRTATPDNWRALAKSSDAVLPFLESLGEELDHERVAALALSYTAQRRDYPVAEQLLRAAGERGRAGHAITAAVTMVRALDRSGQLSHENQLASLDEAVELAPDAFEPRLLRGQVRLEADQPELALADAEDALARRPDDPRARVLRMRARAALDRNHEAAEDADALLRSRFAHGDDDLAREAAAIYVAAGRFEDARPLLEQELLDRDPVWEDGWAMLALVYERAGRERDAEMARYNVAVARANRARQLHRLARLALWQGEVDDARILLEVATSIDPEYAAARDDLDGLAQTALVQ
ncbi:MAG TPA: fused MFS/spermidine synthase [Candidatus Binatia bacterium]